MTGGSFENFSILALSISPYITSSIIIQLLTIAIPKLEELQQDGQEGRKKIAEITRYVTVGLALIQSTAMSIGFGRSGMFEHYTWYNVVVCVITLTAGSAFLMWVGERITERVLEMVFQLSCYTTLFPDFQMMRSRFMKPLCQDAASLYRF